MHSTSDYTLVVQLNPHLRLLFDTEHLVEENELLIADLLKILSPKSGISDHAREIYREYLKTARHRQREFLKTLDEVKHNAAMHEALTRACT